MLKRGNDMNEFLEQLSGLQHMQIQEITSATAEMLGNFILIAHITALVVGLLRCFLGLKLIKVWSALECFAVGVLLGCLPALFVDLLPVATLILMLVVGLVFAVLGVIFSRVGMFIVALVSGIAFATFLFMMTGSIGLIIGLVFAVIMAILAAIFRGPIVIIMTSLQGAALCARASSGLLGYRNLLIELAVFLVLAIVGILLQFLMKSKEMKTKEMEKAEEVRADYSKEIEVEAARSILDEEDDE